MVTLDFGEKICATYFGRNRQVVRWDHDGRVLKYNIIVFVSDGSACFEFMNKKHEVSAGGYVIIPAGELYKVHLKDYCEYYFFHFSGNLQTDSIYRKKEPLTADNYLKLPMYSFKLPDTDFVRSFLLCGSYGAETVKLIKECERLHFDMNRKNRLMIDLKAKEILLTLSENEDSVKESRPAVLNEILNYIHENYREKLSLAEIAEKFRISESYGARIFKKHMDMTAMEYITALKLDYGAQLLLSSSMSVSQIAEYLSYYDVFYFSKRFKERFKLTPTQYRKK